MSVTVMLVAPATTWLLVSTTPSELITMPVPAASPFWAPRTVSMSTSAGSTLAATAEIWPAEGPEADEPVDPEPGEPEPWEPEPCDPEPCDPEPCDPDPKPPPSGAPLPVPGLSGRYGELFPAVLVPSGEAGCS